MSNISWNSQTISNYITTSLGNSANTTCSSIYNSLGDYNLIKTGKYSKLMKAYYKKLAADQENASTANATDSNKVNPSTNNTNTSSSTGNSNASTASTTGTGSIIDTLV